MYNNYGNSSTTSTTSTPGIPKNHEAIQSFWRKRTSSSLRILQSNPFPNLSSMTGKFADLGVDSLSPYVVVTKLDPAYLCPPPDWP
jgi:hypothetical protein